MRALTRFACLVLLAIAISPSSNARDVQQLRANDDKPLPVVLWHGMGDSCCASWSIGKVKQQIEDSLGVFVHSIATGKTTSEDVYSTYFANVNEQVAQVCEDLRSIPELAGGFNAIAFSQGGQFMRAVVERCQHTGLRVRTLITMGGQHQGIMNVPACSWAGQHTACSAVQALVAAGAYAPYIRDHLVQAQYFKDPYHLGTYIQQNIFLPDINNERLVKNDTYRQNLASLEKLVLFRFSQDTTVVPRDSSWFSFFNGTDMLTMQETDLYKEDWIGLKELDESGRLDLAEVVGPHMHFSMQWLVENVIDVYLRAPAKRRSVRRRTGALGALMSALSDTL